MFASPSYSDPDFDRARFLAWTLIGSETSPAIRQRANGSEAESERAVYSRFGSPAAGRVQNGGRHLSKARVGIHTPSPSLGIADKEMV